MISVYLCSRKIKVMPTRAKSKNDLSIQRGRLLYDYNPSPERAERINRIYANYVNNIDNSKTGKRLLNRVREARNGDATPTEYGKRAWRNLNQKYTGYNNPDTTKAVGLNKG